MSDFEPDALERAVIESDEINLAAKVAIAIERIKLYVGAANGAPILCAFSGGKDSQVVYQLAKEAGVDVSAQYSITRFEPPELIKFIREHYPEVIFRRAYKRSLVADITTNGLPTRRSRWCCKAKHEKTKGFEHALVGVRWAESAARRKNWRMQGYKKDKTSYLCPIIDWEAFEVWAFIKSRNLPYCKLYDEGYSRIGCVCCPQVPNQILSDSKRYPKTAAMIFMGVKKFVAKMRLQGFCSLRGTPCSDWKNAESPENEYFTRWLNTGFCGSTPPPYHTKTSLVCLKGLGFQRLMAMTI